MVKRFICYGGFVISPNDGDLHWISARRVAQLHKVNQQECIFIDHNEEKSYQGYDSEFLDTLLELKPYPNWYSPVTPAERRAYPIHS